MPYIQRDSYRLYYEWAGDESSPVLILSHSLGSTHAMWQPQLEAFSRSFRVLLYDHPGHGKSDDRPTVGSMADYGCDVLSLMDELHIERACFCGLSLGGMVGLWLGANATARIEKLVVSNTTAKIVDTTLLRGRLERLRKDGNLEDIVESVLGKWFTQPFAESHPDVMIEIRDMFLTTTLEGYINTSQTVCDMDLRPELTNITVPTLVVCGKHDGATPPEWGMAIADAVPGAKTSTLDAAHMSNVEAAHEFTNTVLDFLGR